MNKKFDVAFLDDAISFLDSLDEKSRNKIIYNIELSSYKNDPKLFKKINDHIWEFRTLYNKRQFRLLAFWDTENRKNTLVVSTHGFVKKTKKIPKDQIKRAELLRKEYFDAK